MAWINNTNMSAKDAMRWGNDGHASMRKANYESNLKSKERDAENRKRIEALEAQVKQQKAAPKPKAKPKPKPKGDQQIEPVEHSPEISAARQVANNYMANQDQSSPWQQAQANADSSAQFGNFNPGGNTSDPTSSNSEVSQMQQNSQAFADKYKLDLINTGATK